MRAALRGSARLGPARLSPAWLGLAGGDASPELAAQEAPGTSLLHPVPGDHKPAQSITLKMSFRSEPTRVLHLLESTLSL